MPILVASDLKGQAMKESVKDLLKQAGGDVLDMGFIGETNISKIGEIIHNYPGFVAIVFCDNASCLSMMLNKYSNVRSIVAHTNEQDLFLARNKHRANIMCIPMGCRDLISKAVNIVSTFVTA